MPGKQRAQLDYEIAEALAQRSQRSMTAEEERAKAIKFGTEWAEDRFRVDPNYAAFTLDMVWLDPAVVPNQKRREAMKNLICTAATKRWRALRDQAKRRQR